MRRVVLVPCPGEPIPPPQNPTEVAALASDLIAAIRSGAITGSRQACLAQARQALERGIRPTTSIRAEIIDAAEGP